jgi:hypothetical protein
MACLPGASEAPGPPTGSVRAMRWPELGAWPPSGFQPAYWLDPGSCRKTRDSRGEPWTRLVSLLFVGRPSGRSGATQHCFDFLTHEYWQFKLIKVASCKPLQGSVAA